MRARFALLLIAPATLAAQDRTPGAAMLTPADRTALEQLSGDYAAEYGLVDSWFAGRPIQYYHFGPSQPQAASFYRVRGGGEVFSSVPGVPGYSALRQVYEVEVLPPAGVSPAQLRSHDEILRLVRQGAARLIATGTVLNLPVVPEGSSLERDPAARPLREATYRGRTIHYFDFGLHRPAVIPLMAFARSFPADGEPLDPVPGQLSNASAIPGSARYSDLWAVQVAVGTGYGPGSYRDYRQVIADARAGRIEVRDRGLVVTCPVMYVDGRPAARPAPWLPPVTVAAAPPPAQPISAPDGAITEQHAAGPAAAPPAPALAPAGHVYHGRSNRLDVDLPRAEASVVVDGVLDEPVWQSAAVLTGFSQYEPQDGMPAEDSTEVLVWYSDHAIHFGVRAFEPHGTSAVRAQLADRDKISADDNIQIFLDTFNDRRRALYFAVNPLGRQADGIRNDRGGSNDADLAEDFQFQSKGRLTDYGYEVEIRIPFKSMRYQAVPVQDWGVQVVREVQHSKYTQTWTPARKAGQSFLGQSGRLKGLRQLKRGLVMDINPELTSHVDGRPATAPAAGWNYASPAQEVGGNVRWGIGTNLTVNATANPDFSQVEADVQQIQYDPRSAVRFPEKRPFFVEGGEQFDAPHSLIYTRKIVQPVTALKLNGKAAGANIGLLSAVDARTATGTPGDSSYPIVNLLRFTRDFGPQSTVGITYTDRVDGADWSRVGSADARVVFARLYALTASYAHSFNRVDGVSSNAPIWRVNLDRTGRRFGFSYNAQGTHPLFRTAVGFVNRTDIATTSVNHRFTWFGERGKTLENYTLGINLSTTWWYDSLLTFKEPNDPKLHLNNTFTFRGGWRVTANVLLESFRYDPNLYRNYYVERALPGGAKDTVPYVGTHRIQNLDLTTSLTTPQFSTFRASLNVIVGRDENFEEWAPAFIFFPTATIDWNPSSRVRVNFRYPWNFYIRPTDWSTVRRRQIPRLKVEYQANRAIFFRFVGQYEAQFRDDLRDDSRTGFPVLLRSSAGAYTRPPESKTNNFRMDVLFSFQPNPGTVFFAGYGTSMREPEAFHITDLDRVSDGFFVKLSYLFRL